MLSIYNGRRRSLGEDESKDIYLQISVKMRKHLRNFKGARLGVFIAIALHVDDKGWAWPTVKRIKTETGYEDDTIYRALSDLCGGIVKGQPTAPLQIRGHRVMLRTRTAPPHVPAELQDNKRNFYLFFPTDAEVKTYEREEAGAADKTRDDMRRDTSENTDTYFSDTKNSDIKNSDNENTDTYFSDTKKTHVSEVEPPSEVTPPTHKQPPTPARGEPLFERAQGAVAGGVRVPSAFKFEQRLEWAEHEASLPGSQIKNARSVAAARADGTADEQIAAYFRGRAATPARRCDPACPLCFGTQFEAVPGKGARPCPNRTPVAADTEPQRAAGGGGR